MNRATAIVIALVLMGCTFAPMSPADPNVSEQEASSDVRRDIRWTIEEVARDLEVPWDIAILLSGDLLVTERQGRVQRVAQDGAKTLIADLPQVVSTGESGLTGITLDPEFESNRYVYLYYSYRVNGLKNRISRFTLSGEQLIDEHVIVDALPGGKIHNGGRMRFGPDGNVWILTGDAASPKEAQSRESLGGKILRVHADGSIPSDNPFPGSPIYSLGHRNPQGLDWDPSTKELLSTEHGWNAHDEVNRIQAGANYGWPIDQQCASSSADFTTALLCSNSETWAPSGIAFLHASDERLKGSFVIAGLRGSFLRRYVFDGSTAKLAETLVDGTYGRLRAVTAAADGSVFVTTSNRDGRGRVQNGDDRILRIRSIE